MNDLIDWQQTLLILTLSLPRMMAAFMLLPVFSRQSLPGMAHIGVMVSLALLALPIVMADAPPTPPTWAQGFAIVIKEMTIGLLIGFGAAIPFWVIDSTGFFIDNQRGTTMASSIDPMTGSQTSPLGVLLTQALVALFFVGGGALMFLDALYESYRLWPVFSFFPRLGSDALPALLGMLDRFMGLTVLLAAPIIIAMFMTEFAMGLISRATPQMNVFSLAMPIKSAVGILILAVYAILLFGFLNQEMLGIAAHFKILGRLFQ